MINFSAKRGAGTLIEETYIDGQNRTIWCRSNLPVPVSRIIQFCSNNCIENAPHYHCNIGHYRYDDAFEIINDAFCLGQTPRANGVFFACMWNVFTLKNYWLIYVDKTHTNNYTCFGLRFSFYYLLAFFVSYNATRTNFS
jgi:hypothetical protein